MSFESNNVVCDRTFFAVRDVVGEKIRLCKPVCCSLKKPRSAAAELQVSIIFESRLAYLVVKYCNQWL